MADRARRKSSILKIPKQRAPLQDVNSLSQEIKSSQEEDLTSYTANLRRRVSFAGKNFVKEFCAEAEIASVHHAVEYEQEWQASTDSSGLVMSDVSNNTHSNAGISQNHSHIRFQNSEIRSSVVIDDFIDPCDEIMREFQGTKATQPQVKKTKPVNKCRFSFGEIEVKSLDPSQGDANTVEDKAPEHQPLQSVSKNCISVQTTHVTHNKTVQEFHAGNPDSSKVFHNVRVDEEFVCNVKKTTKTHVVHQDETDENSSRFCHPGTYSSPPLSGIGQNTCQSEVFGEQSTCLSEVFRDVCQSQHQLPHETVDFHDAVNKTVLDESGMDFTRVVPGLIECGIQISSAGVGTETNVPQLQSSIGDLGHGGVVAESGNGYHESEVDDDYDGPYTQAEPSGQRADEQPANVTQCMDESMELTRAVPGTIQLGFEFHRAGQVVDSHIQHFGPVEYTSAASNSVGPCASTDSHQSETEPVGSQSLENASETSEFKVATKENIPGNDQVKAECLSGRIKDVSSNSTLLTSASMEFTTMLPDNICFNVEDQNKDQEREEVFNIPSHSTTQVMSASMEFTKVLPSNIQCNVEEKVMKTSALEHENIAFDRTTAINTSMELTVALPSNIQIDFSKQANEIGREEKGDLSRSITQSRAEDKTEQGKRSQARGSSVKCTTLVPSNIEEDHNGGPNTVLNTTYEEIPNQNQTNVMCASMEFTRPLHSNIVTNAEFNSDLHDEKSFCEGEEAMDVQENHVILNVEVQEKSKDENQLSFNRKHTMKPSDSSKMQNTMTVNVEHISIGDGSEKCQSERLDSHHKNQEEFIRNANSGTSTTPQTMSSQVSPLQSSNLLERMSLSSISNPFKTKPRLISSPTSQSGIEAVLVQTVSRSAVNDKIVPVCNYESESTVGGKDFSVQESVGQREVVCASHVTDFGKDTFAQAKDLVNVPDPFISKPRLLISPAKPELSGQISQEAGTVGDDESTKTDKDTVGMKSSGVLPLPSGEKHCMLLDVSPPFHDISSNNSIEISVNVTDSCTNLLHTTIKNAEITLRQMQCSGLEEGPEEMNGPGKSLEDMDCDHDSAEDSSMSQCDQIEGNCNNVRSSSPNNVNNMEWETSYDSSKSAKRPHASISDSEEPTCAKSSEGSKRSRYCNLEHKETGSNNSSNSLKQLCSSNSDLSRNDVCDTSKTGIDSDPGRVLTHSSLKDCSSETNCCSLSITSNSSHQSIDDIIFENQRRHPQYWTAVKGDKGMWSIKFKCTELELKVHLQSSLQNYGSIVALNGCFTSNVTDKTKPAKRWGMSILMEKVKSEDWNSLVSNTSNFIDTLQKIVQEVVLFRKFIIQLIILEKLHNIEFHNDSLSFDITSVKCHLWFQVILQLDSWEKYSPKHISIKNIVGETRESEVKNLITGVKKDIYFLRNYITDIKDYVKTLEQFC